MLTVGASARDSKRSALDFDAEVPLVGVAVVLALCTQVLEFCCVVNFVLFNFELEQLESKISMEASATE